MRSNDAKLLNRDRIPSEGQDKLGSSGVADLSVSDFKGIRCGPAPVRCKWPDFGIRKSIDTIQSIFWEFQQLYGLVVTKDLLSPLHMI